MATLSNASLASIKQQSFPCSSSTRRRSHLLHLTRPKNLCIRASKLPDGVVVPKMKPKLSEPFLGFTKTAEIWNSRACMIGLIGTFIVELVFHKGILQMIGVDVGNGLDLPL